jgi:predicted peptidase
MAAVLKALGGDVRYTEVAGADHAGAAGAMNRAYTDREIAAWLLTQWRR